MEGEEPRAEDMEQAPERQEQPQAQMEEGGSVEVAA